MIPESLSPIANHLWQSTLFGGVAGLLTLALRKNSARVRHWVWVVASLKFLVPFSLLIAIGSRIEWRTAPAIAPVPGVIAQVSQPITMMMVSSPVLTTARTAPSMLPQTLLAIWACGFIGICAAWVIRWRRIKNAVRAGLLIELGLPIQTISSPSFLEPGIFGVLRPILLLPDGIFKHLPQEQWKSVVAHELCHVRRRDNLVGVVQMFVESAFWFHPLVWWIGKRIFQEREMACDEEVLRRGSEPRTYAQGILKVCELYLESPVKCVAGVSGSNLRKRIEEIMRNRTALKLNFGRKLLMASAGTLAVAGPLAVGILNSSSIRAQSRPQFEAVSVKVHKGGSFVANTTTRKVEPAGITFRNIALGEFIEMAYGVKHYQVAGPDWVVNYGSTDRYDLEAKAAGPLPPAQLWQMVVPVLEERFKLVVHRETKELPVYALLVAKGGPKFKEGDGGERDVKPDWTGAFVYKNYSMQELADALSGLLERPTLNRTGLEGRYDFRANLQSIAAGLSEADQKRAALENQGDSPDSPVFTNLQEQLGLRIESQKAPIPFIVVDHAEKVPTEN